MEDLNDKVTGGSLSATQWNQVPSEIQNVIEALGQTLTDADLDQLGKSIAAYSGAGDYYNDIGAADAYIVQAIGSKQGPPVPLTADSDGLMVRFRPANANTGASTINVAAHGVVALVREDGSALAANDLITTRDAICRYEFSTDNFRLQSFTISSSIDVPRGYIDGLTLSNNSIDPDADVDFAPGIARDATNNATMTLSGTLVKQLDTGGGWVVGTNNAGLPTPLTIAADTWYHCFEIMDGSGTVDAGFDTSLTAVNLLADSGYTYYRRLGSVLTDATSDILIFLQEGDEFFWLASSGFTDISLDPTTASMAHTLAHVPTGFRVRAHVTFSARTPSGSGNAYSIIVPGDVTTASAGASDYDLWTNGEGEVGQITTKILTNTSAQVKTNSNNASTIELNIRVLGWVDSRGKDA